eukprot:6469759-Amphidinium_carterae.3
MKRAQIQGQGQRRTSDQPGEELHGAWRNEAGQSSTAGSSPSEVISHLDVISNVALDLEENHIITEHSLTINEDKNEKATQISTSDVILQDWYPDVTEMNSEKLKKAMLHELNHLTEHDVYEEVNTKSHKPEQVQSTIKTIWVIAERSPPTGEVSIKARFVGKGYTQSMDPESLLQVTLHHDHKKYRTSIEKLLWLSASRPDIQFSVKELNRKVSAPSFNAEKAVKHLIKELNIMS